MLNTPRRRWNMRACLVLFVCILLGGGFVKETESFRQSKNAHERMIVQRQHEIQTRRYFGQDFESSPSLPASNAFTKKRTRYSFESTAWIALINVCLNCVRPEEWVPFQARIPRILWETIIAFVSVMVSTTMQHHQKSPALYLLLAFMTWSTAIIDIFVWAPLYALASSFGNDYGLRLMVSVQSLATGVFYLLTSIMAWGAFTALRDEQTVQNQARSLELHELRKQQAVAR